MKVATGKSILNGIAIGTIRCLRRPAVQAAVSSTLTPEEERKRFEQARRQAQAQLKALYDNAVSEVGEENAAIFDIHSMMLDDEDYLDAVRCIIDTQGATAEHAVHTTGENFAAAFAAMDDTYMQARAVDVRDISRRVVHILAGCPGGTAVGSTLYPDGR